MTTVHWEMQSFIWKLSQLAHAGFNASLNFNFYQGRMFVNFSSDLGEFQVPVKRSKHVKPSQIRRNKRRREARVVAQNENPSEEGITFPTMNEDIATEAVTNVHDCNEEETLLIEAGTDLKDENDSVLSTTSPMPNAYNYNCILKPEIMYATQSPYEQNDQVMASSAFVQISEESTAVNPDELGNSKYWDEMAMMLRYLTARSNQQR